MARPIVLSNGELHVGLNGFGTVHDFYYPYVGFENHSAGSQLRHKVGVWVDGDLSWIDNPKNPSGEWTFDFHYPHDALVGHTKAKNHRLGVMLEFDDFVDSDLNVFVRNIHIINMFDTDREIRLFMHQAFAIGDSRSNTDTAQYLPDTHAILHYRGRRAFIVSGSYNDQPFDQYTVGLFGIEGKEGTFYDALDGKLDMNNVEHGRVDSTIGFDTKVKAHSSARVQYWIAVGKSTREALQIHKAVRDDGALSHMLSTGKYWHEWLKPTHHVIDKIPSDHKEKFIQSLIIIKSQIDKRGAVIASTDTSMLHYSRDAYSYCWPRDGAYALWPLIRIGFKDEAYRFFSFIKHGLHTDGYMMHKYRADGALGSSWHPYLHGDVVAPPIQEDETALPLFMFAQLYHLNPEQTLLKEFYKSMVVPMADFMAGYIDDVTGLPKPSYDLWEQTFMISTYTTAVTYAALIAASDLASEANDPNNAVKWRSTASDIQMAAHKHLYNNDRQVFYRGLNVIDGQVAYDDVIDCSSVFGSYIFGLFAPDSHEIVSSINTIEQAFGIDKGAVGLPRYENDPYRRMNSEITGNLWYVTSLWLAQYYIDNDKADKASDILDWIKNHMMSTGVMGEQINPITNEIISPAPLTWSHAEYISTLLDLITIKT